MDDGIADNHTRINIHKVLKELAAGGRVVKMKDGTHGVDQGKECIIYKDTQFDKNADT